MERYAMKQLINWKNKNHRKPLILKGARQVGKTWLMKEFGKTCFKNVAYINLDKNERFKGVFEKDYNIDRIIMAINIETGIKIIPNETLIILDECGHFPYLDRPNYFLLILNSFLMGDNNED